MSAESTGPRKPLMVAVIENDIEKLKEALAATPPPTTEELGIAAYSIANSANEKHLLAIKLILDRDASLCGSLVGPACRNKDTELFQLMYDNGWGEDQINASFSRPYEHLLSVVRSVKALQWLLDHGLDPNLPAERGMSGCIGDLTPLNAVAKALGSYADIAIEAMELLVSRGAVLDYNVLKTALVRGRREACFDGDVPRWILQHATDFDINTPSRKGYPLLHAAILNQRQQLVAWLLENGADPSIRVKHKGRWKNAVKIAEEVCNVLILDLVIAAAKAQ
ncbi:hypothetical protein CkaCkLH20_01756 [Colletotrichum karsti]|uniref:Ankyrin repeat protein n=1 Tax=Colletotrichum karsti TaxID=1095194 RepID=A0A9P6IDA6_9PEZI|nr:uncharacterized protein CkaCkLH20_01756 [Colletotrichum karsti]KAF9880714.1 hypothetical protein CkaCkLH20_01756 [Colletotrichum karsti]